jgi:uncharacterized protein YggU (UPF0235/DUF167 family)
VQKEASSNLVENYQRGSLRLLVTASGEHGRANKAVIELSAEALEISKSRLTILKGQKSREKSIGVKSLTPGKVDQRLTSAIA